MTHAIDITLTTTPAAEGPAHLPGGLESLRSTHAETGYTVDFSRNLCLVLGLPFDVIDLDGAEARLREAVATRTRLFISTPNTNFVVAARRDTAFRDSVLHSDLSLMDGTPLVWVARLMGIPIPERVSGSDLFERLNMPGAPPLKVYFFGGPPGVAAQASTNLNARCGPLQCVGHDEGGFGSVEDMSSDDVIARINASGADFLVVALGAGKGQAWIEHNLRRLTVPVVSHLGAVVNFVAGSVKRAPPWMRRSGLEWLWRVKEEPRLWQRYASDAAVFLRLIAFFVLPESVRRLFGEGRREHEPCCAIEEDSAELKLRATVAPGSASAESLRAVFSRIASRNEPVEIHLDCTQRNDDHLKALIMLLVAHRRRCRLPVRFSEASKLSGRDRDGLGALVC
jgi:N-acetylglucosaminyldiphosphoundecaprenol N-acetyl-beta-D-mannosaminyltransferase